MSKGKSAMRKEANKLLRKIWPVTLVAIASGTLLLWWGGCSVEKNYKMLSFFFDGVPDPNAPDRYGGLAMAQSPTYSEHQPFTQEACLECHEDPSDMTLAKNDSSMCSKCHVDVAYEYSYMHGAVLGEACLMCHNPHYSALANLLRDDGPGMCTQCHQVKDDGLNLSHSDLERNCIDCHAGHGGDSPFFLLSVSKLDSDPTDKPGAEQSDPQESGQSGSSILQPEGDHGS